MHHDKADRVATAACMPADESVGPYAALKRREACHQCDQDDAAKTAEKSGDPAGVGEPDTPSIDRRGVAPPQQQRCGRTGEDDTEYRVRMGTRTRRRRGHPSVVPVGTEPRLRSTWTLPVRRDSPPRPSPTEAPRRT